MLVGKAITKMIKEILETVNEEKSYVDMFASALFKVKDKKSDIYKKLHKVLMKDDEEAAKRGIKALIKYSQVLELIDEK